MLQLQHLFPRSNLASPGHPPPGHPRLSPNSPTAPIRRKIDNRTFIRRTAEDACHRNRRQDETFAPAIPRPVLLHAPQSRGRGHHDPPLPPEQNRRRPVLQSRPGSRLRRQRLRPREKRLDGADDPQHRRAAGQRRSPARHLHAAHGEIYFAHQGQGRHKPLWRSRKPAHRFAHLHARRSHSRAHRRRHGRPLSRPENRGHDLDRRRRQLHRRLSRRPEFRRGAESSFRADSRK